VVVGSNAFNLAAMLGLGAVFVARVRARHDALEIEAIAALWFVTVCLAVVAGWIGGRIGLVLVALAAVPYVFLLGRGEPPEHPRARAIDVWRECRRLVLVLAAALALIVGGSIGAVRSATDLGHSWSVPPTIVGVLVLAILTSLPNAFTAARLAFQQRGSAVVSETMNSNTTNLVFGISVPALFVSLGSTAALTQFELGWLLLMTLAAIALLGRRGGVTRSGGLAILLLYAVFVAVELIAVT
jgi:cation:H+ antiporter